MGKKLSYEKVVETLKNLGYELLDLEYFDVDSKLNLKDSKGYLYHVRLDHLRRGHEPRKFYHTNPYSIQNIALWLVLNNKPYKIVSEKYLSCNERLIFTDNEGYFYKVLWSTIYSNRIPDRFNVANPYTIQNIKLWCQINKTPFELLDDTYIESQYEGMRLKCLVDGCEEEFTSSWQKIITGECCPYCHGKRVGLSNCLATRNPNLASEWHPTKNGDLTPYDVTSMTHERVWWQCKEGHEWASPISSRNRKDNNRSCPECNESKGEKRVKQILTLMNVSFDAQYTFEDLIGLGGGLLKFDVPVFWDKEKTTLRLLIEYDGIFHYAKQYEEDGFERLQVHDMLKNRYCTQSNIPLIRIPYWEFDNIENILEDILINNNMNSEYIINNK